ASGSPTIAGVDCLTAGICLLRRRLLFLRPQAHVCRRGLLPRQAEMQIILENVVQVTGYPRADPASPSPPLRSATDAALSRSFKVLMCRSTSPFLRKPANRA